MEFKQLRVLILKFWGDRKQFDLSGIFVLCQLRYVQITTDIVIKLPVRMQGLKYLETLEIYAILLTVPSDIVHLPKLLHLHLQGEIKLPDFVGQLKFLRTLQSCDLSRNSEDNVKSLGEMVNLRDLHIICSTTSSDHLKRNLIALASSIGKHENLKSLTLAPDVSCPSIFTDCSSIVSSPPVFLEKFELLPPICIFSRLPYWFGQLQNLRVLKIAVRELRRDDLNRIAGLPELTVLSLYIRQPTAESIVFNSASFPSLKYLKLRCPVLRLAFQAEAIPNLRRLKLEFNAHSRDQYSDMLANIEHLVNLQEINVRIGVAPGAQEFNKLAAETVFKDIISKHLRFNVQRADFIEEDQIPLAPGLATTSSHSDGLLYLPTTVDVTRQSSEIEVFPVPQMSPLNDDNVTSDRDIQTNRHQGVPKFGNARKGNSPSGERRGSSEENHGTATTPGRSKMRSSCREDEMPERGSVVPKFGEWEASNEKDPSTGDGFTDIFNKVREEKQSGHVDVPGDYYVGRPQQSIGEGFSDIFNKVREEKQSGHVDVPGGYFVGRPHYFLNYFLNYYSGLLMLQLFQKPIGVAEDWTNHC